MRCVVRAGDLSVERTGVVHWWRNESTAPVRALVVDIVPVEAAAPPAEPPAAPESDAEADGP